MVPIQIKVKVKASPELEARLREISNGHRLAQAIGNDLLTATLGNFTTRHRYRPTPWARKANGEPSYLVLHGVLSRSLVLSVVGRVATISTDRPYAAIHQFGGRTRPHAMQVRRGKGGKFSKAGYLQAIQHPGSNIPPRPFLPMLNGALTPAAAKLAQRAAQDVVGRILKGK